MGGGSAGSDAAGCCRKGASTRTAAGRKPIYDAPMRETMVSLPEPLIEAYREYGDGVVSAGVRRLGEKYLLKRRKDR
jgi:hypothetical protein